MDNTDNSTPHPNELDDQGFRSDDFKKAYGESFTDATNIDTWHLGEDLAEVYALSEKELLQAKLDEKSTHRTLREVVFPRIKERGANRVPYAGLHDEVDDIDTIEKVHRGFLFNGAVTACGSTSTAFDSVPISITQIGICLVSYEGQLGSYSHRLYRRDLRYKNKDIIEETIKLIEQRSGDDMAANKKAQLSNLAVRGIKTYAERAILLEKASVKEKLSPQWLMSSGSPAPYELMTGFWASRSEMKDQSIGMMRKMIMEHKKFVFIQDCSTNQLLWTLGNALKPYEYLIFDTMESSLVLRVETGGTRSQFRKDYTSFAHEAGSKIAVGVYRVSYHSPPQIFYCHIDQIPVAALIAMADSMLQLHQGRPLLLDLAQNLCQNAFGKADFMATIQQAYANTELAVRISNID